MRAVHWGTRNNMAQKDVCFRKIFEMHALEFNEIYEEHYFDYFFSVNREKCV